MWQINLDLHKRLMAKGINVVANVGFRSTPENALDVLKVCGMGFIIYKITFWKCELWLAKSRVSITVWKAWNGSRHYTSSHTPSHTSSRTVLLWSRYTGMSRLPETYFIPGLYDLGTPGCPEWPRCVYLIKKSVEKFIIICQ